MDSWSYDSEEKSFLPNESTLSRSKGLILGWELKSSSGISSDMLSSGQPHMGSQGFDEMGFPEMLQKHMSDDPISSMSSRKLEVGPFMAVTAPIVTSGFEDSNSKLSNSVVESNGRDSLIDLKLGRFGDPREGLDSAFSKGTPMLSSSESSAPTKRVRGSGSGLHSQTAYCQVYGCNKDLSGCKDYHKRHKVCEVHSKTSKVIVNGIEQRFCQQCSRFHLLAEFDDGKRSCRKRLAGHNERRRKPQVGIHSAKAGRLLQSYSDSRFQGTMLTTASFICQDILPTGTLRSDKYGTNNWWRPLKNEDGTDFRHLSGVPISNGHHQSRSLFSSFNERQFPFLHENGTTSSTGSILFENNQYPPPPAISGPQSLFQDTSLRSEDFNVYDTTSTTIQGLSGVSDSGCALSLLSSQSQNSSSHSSGIPMAARPLVIPSSSHSNYSQSQLAEKIVGMSSHASSTNAGVSDRFRSEMNPASNGGSHLNPVLISDNSNILNFDMADGMFQGPGFVNMKDGPTIDLLQLSSQLQRVEHQRQSSQAKQENDSTL